MYSYAYAGGRNNVHCRMGSLSIPCLVPLTSGAVALSGAGTFLMRVIELATSSFSLLRLRSLLWLALSKYLGSLFSVVPAGRRRVRVSKTSQRRILYKYLLATLLVSTQVS